MKIHAGYEIDCPQPTPMILMLSVHPSRFPDLLTEDRMRLDPPIPTKTYHDSFGNFCSGVGPDSHCVGSECSRKKRTISLAASGPRRSV